MAMTDAERREAARQFYYKWKDKGNEDEDDRSYWIDFLQDVMGVFHVTDRIEFQKKVLNDKGHLSNRIDAYIPETRVLIEQKSRGIDLSKPQPQHGNKTPYEQAKDYDNALPVSEKAKWIIVSNFAEIWIYDMDSRKPEPKKVSLEEMPSKYGVFDFLVNKEQKVLTEEQEISVKAGRLVGLLYDAFRKEYLDPDSEESLKCLNVLCVRLVFCLYAEDAMLFGGSRREFHDYMEAFSVDDMRQALIDLFHILNTREDLRDKYDKRPVSKFPYVNGGLFEREIEIPNFTEEIRTVLLDEASLGFDWSGISPTIFGACFESTIQAKKRREGGMVYTSVENIHKVIDPLFLDELRAEFEELDKIQVLTTKKKKMEQYQIKLAGLLWMDPAAGSGNFLTETYLSVRRLENKAIRAILDCDPKQVNGQIVIGEVLNDPIKVKISQFYGIEIDDFAVSVARTALWIAESQMMKETEAILNMQLDFLPLRTNAHIVEGNALRLDWNEVVPKDRLNYIMGNPPFVGYSVQNKAQKEDLLQTYVDENGVTYKKAGKIDYVSGWYYKASQMMKDSGIRSAFVSTNSITQGEQVPCVWEPLYEQFGIKIDFAYRAFRWDSESTSKARVHCVIIGFSSSNIRSSREQRIYDNGTVCSATNINPYLLDAPNIFINSTPKPICNVPEIFGGCKPADDGHLILDEAEKEELLKKEPLAEKFIRPFMMGKDFIERTCRYCLWLVDADPAELNKCPMIMERVGKVKEFRMKSKKEATQRKAETPTLFDERHISKTDYVAIPVVSSEQRRYIPMEILPANVIAGNKLFLMPEATLFSFGVLTSNVHMAWMRAFCGRLEMRYSYSNTIVYNTFPWPSPTPEQKKKIEETAQEIFNARALYPNSSLADLYNPLTMPQKLQKAHTANDRAVMQAYGFDIKDMTEADCVAELMKMYQELTKDAVNKVKK